MDTKTIGSKIANARRGKNMSQAQLAQLLFISPQAVGKWERGESVPDIITLNRLAEIAGVDLNYFSENFPSAPDEVNSAMADDTGTAEQPAGSQAPSPQRPLLTNFSGSNLPETDFAGVTAHHRKFNGSAMRNCNFAGSDLTGSSISGSDVHEANFDGANLTDCTLSANNLSGASFCNTLLLRTEISASCLFNAKFSNAELTDARLMKTDLRNTAFENCIFKGVDFKYSDLRGVCLDGNTFIDVKFQKAALNEATFNGATIKNVSFCPEFGLTNKYYKAVKTIRFDGARMDKLTYASLKGIGADLSNVTIV